MCFSISIFQFEGCVSLNTNPSQTLAELESSFLAANESISTDDNVEACLIELVNISGTFGDSLSGDVDSPFNQVLAHLKEARQMLRALATTLMADSSGSQVMTSLIDNIVNFLIPTSNSHHSFHKVTIDKHPAQSPLFEASAPLMGQFDQHMDEE